MARRAMQLVTMIFFSQASITKLPALDTTIAPEPISVPLPDKTDA